MAHLAEFRRLHEEECSSWRPTGATQKQSQFCHSGSKWCTSFLKILGQPCAFVSKIRQPFLHSGACLRRSLEDADAGTDLVDIPEGRGAIEAARFGDIHLGDDRGIGGVEKRWVLERFVFTF